MEQLNTSQVAGNIVRDCVVNKTTTGRSVCNFTVAVSRTETASDYINITAWGSDADELGRYGTKGTFVYVAGRTSQSPHEKNGERRYEQKITANVVKIFASKPRKEEPAPEPAYDEDLPY